jgi:DNA-binding GntR family transcriptional regulator
MNRPDLSISRNYLHDQVVQQLRALILSGDLEPKAKLNEAALAERFGISRTPLREAINVLSAEGLLELLPNRGARVASLSHAEIDEMLDVVAALEMTAGELACRHATEDQIVALNALNGCMVRAHAEGDVETYFEINREIHQAIIAASRNRVLQGIYETLSGRIQRSRYRAHKTAEQWAAALDDHNRMIALLKARDGAALGALLRDHVRSKKAVIAAAYSDEQAAG